VNDQLWLDEHSAAWGQQHDPVDHQLRGARSYELPVLATAETAELVRVLARRSGRSPDIDRAISAALVWLERHRLVGVRWERSATSGSGLLPDPAAEGLWPRFVDPESQSAIFADRDGARRDSVTQLSVERQRGYGWYTTAPIELLDKTRSSP
jgi:PelA/Pel-15E family pectate lyase